MKFLLSLFVGVLLLSSVAFALQKPIGEVPICYGNVTVKIISDAPLASNEVKVRDARKVDESTYNLFCDEESAQTILASSDMKNKSYDFLASYYIAPLTNSSFANEANRRQVRFDRISFAPPPPSVVPWPAFSWSVVPYAAAALLLLAFIVLGTVLLFARQQTEQEIYDANREKEWKRILVREKVKGILGEKK